MASLHVRNLDEKLVTRLKERAAKHGRSAEAEHREILKRALSWEMPERNDEGLSWDERAARLREATKGRAHTPSEVLLRESRDER
jgi:plasmid stability protein